MNMLNIGSDIYKFGDLELLIPNAKEVQRMYEENGNVESFPFWSRIWPASSALATWLSERPEVSSGMRVLELGAGIGLPSFVAARWAKFVVASDVAPDAIDWMKENIRRAGAGNMLCRKIDWTKDELPEADLILLSDVGYHEKDFEPLRALIFSFVHGGAKVLLAVPARMISAAFIAMFGEFERKRHYLRSEGTDVLLLVLAVNGVPI